MTAALRCSSETKYVQINSSSLYVRCNQIWRFTFCSPGCRVLSQRDVLMYMMCVHRTMKARVCDTHTDLNSSTLATPTCLPPSPILVDPNSLKHTIQSISASRAAVTDRSCPRAAIPSSFQLYPWYVYNTYHSFSHALTDHICPILPRCLQ